MQDLAAGGPSKAVPTETARMLNEMPDTALSAGIAAHILVIDDRPEELRPLLELLKAKGARLSLADDPWQGLQRALALYPDLILLDVHMPPMSGFALCRLLREAPATRHIPIIFLGSTVDSKERLQGLLLGGVDYVLKPRLPAERLEVLARIGIHLRLTWREPRSQPLESAAPQDPEQLILHAAMRLIGRSLEQVPPLAEVARQVGTYDKKLTRIFRRYLGMTVFAWVREERLRKSQELLADSGMEIQDIAALVGFGSACNFTTAFRRRTGLTPSEYRERMRSGQPPT